MDNVRKPLVVKDLQFGETRVLQPNSGNHFFRGTKMLETPYNNQKDNLTKDSMYNLNNKGWTGSFRGEVQQRKNGGWLFNELNGDGKLLPYLKRQEGGMTETREDTLGEDYGAADDTSSESEDFGSKVQNIMANLEQSAIPPSIKSELEFFKANPEHQGKLTEDYIKKYIPAFYQYLRPASKPKTQGANTEPAKPGPTAVISDFETRQDPQFQYGGYTSAAGFNNARQLQAQQATSSPPKVNYETGTRIMYRSGGQIKEGVVEHYDPISGEIKLY